MWLTFALVGYAMFAVVFVLDKFILTESFDKPVVYTFYSTIFMSVALFAWPFGVELLQGVDWLLALASGLGFGFGMWAMFIAVRRGEASHVNPFIGVIITIVTFVFASVFLGESLVSYQKVGILILVISTLLLAFFNEKGFVFFDKSFVWGIVAAILFAISHTTAKYLYEIYPFLTGFVWTRATTGLVGIFTLCFVSVRNSLSVKKLSRIKSAKRSRTIFIVIVDKLLSVVGVVLVQLAIALGSVTIVNALVGVQYAIMFIFIYLLTTFAPKLLKEKFSHSEIMVQTTAIILVIAGSALFVF